MSGGSCNPYSPFFPAQRPVDFVGANCVRPPAIIGPPTIIIVPPAGRFCRGELRSPTGNNRPTDNNNRPTGNNRPARFLGFWGNLGYLGARDAPLRVFGGIWEFGRTQCAPTGFGGIWVIWAHAMRPYGVLGEFGFFGVFWGYLGARDAPLRVFGGIWFFWGNLGLFGRTRCAPTGFWGNLGFLGEFGDIWAHAMRPYGVLWELRKKGRPTRIKGKS